MAIRVELPPEVWDEVCALAVREWRTPKQQAEYLILQALGWKWPPADDAPQSTKPKPAKTSAVSAQEGSTS